MPLYKKQFRLTQFFKGLSFSKSKIHIWIGLILFKVVVATFFYKGNSVSSWTQSVAKV